MINKKSGFTLIELLVVIAIIGLLSSIVLASINSARVKSRDARRKSDLEQLKLASEFFYDEGGIYPNSSGWVDDPINDPIVSDLTPTYISEVSVDPINTGSQKYMYWRKDYRGYGCLTDGTADQFAFYTTLENPSTNDAETISDSFDICVQNTWGANYKIGN